MLNILMKEVYYFLKRIVDSYGYMRFIKKSRICVKDTQETINYILNNRVSVSRFGDGEYRVMSHKMDTKIPEHQQSYALHLHMHMANK